jgi:hypothetical protein
VRLTNNDVGIGRELHACCCEFEHYDSSLSASRITLAEFLPVF